jgi:acetyl-CoA carboxylase carboxyltransferase component
MEVNALGAEELAAFREAAQPAVTALIAERYGAAGTAMLEEMLAALEE